MDELAQPDLLQAIKSLLLCLTGGRAPYLEREHDVLQGGEDRHEIEALEYVSDLFVAEL